MKTIALLLLTAGVGFAEDLTLAWTASPTPGVTNYTLTQSSGTNVVRFDTGTNLTLVVTVQATNEYTFFATAQMDGEDSDPSNIIEWPPSGPSCEPANRT